MIASQKIVVAGIGTEVGKTVVSAALVHLLKADYWKPIQAGELENSDSIKVAEYTQELGKLHPEAYRLNSPMSPHAAAAIDQIEIQLEKLVIPQTENHLIIELAGGLMVPLNNQQSNLDWLKKIQLPVVLVSCYYLGQINHTLLSIEVLKANKIPLLGIIFNGKENKDSKKAILEIGNTIELGTLPHLEEVNYDSIKKAAHEIRLDRALTV
ncbi:MAG: dethiobiotin synthase [Flavobacteriales bacterium]|nr:dethiobiotin synthase [Flavobacteriales bacterium]